MASLKLRLFFIAILFLALPAIAFQYLQEVKRFVVSSQQQSQLMMAEGIAALMYDRTDLLQTYQPSQNFPLFVSPTLNPKRVDGKDQDWETRLSPNLYDGFKMRLAENAHYIYLLVEVDDDRVVFRHPNYLRLDTNDHLRLAFIDKKGKKKRYILTTTRPGPVSVYHVNSRWQYALSGRHDTNIEAALKTTDSGYRVEIKFPKLMMNNATEMSVSVVDVNDPAQRKIEHIARTHHQDQSSLNKVIARSVELEMILKGLNHKQAQVWVVDANGRVRGEQGLINRQSPTQNGWWEKLLGFVPGAIEDIPSTTVTRNEEIIQQTLMGHPQSQVRKSTDQQAKIIMAAAPIYDNNQKVIGAVLIEQSNLQILSLQQSVLTKLLFSFALVILIVYGVLFWFAIALVSRIRQLQLSLKDTLDNRGRIISQTMPSAGSKDELGELSREIESLLLKLKGYTDYLERMPKVLRHEIHNPLNIIQSALFNLEDSDDKLKSNKYFSSAKRGLNRMEMLVNSLTSASSLHEALHNEEKETFDLYHLLKTYTENLNLQLERHQIVLHSDLKTLPFYGNDHRIEQMLDKLIDNAVSFASENSEIVVTLMANHHITLQISNDGPIIQEEMLESVLNPMVRIRENQSPEMIHLGIGLYVVQQIVENHHGQIKVMNRADNSGVSINIIFPMDV